MADNIVYEITNLVCLVAHYKKIMHGLLERYLTNAEKVVSASKRPYTYYSRAVIISDNPVDSTLLQNGSPMTTGHLDMEGITQRRIHQTSVLTVQAEDVITTGKLRESVSQLLAVPALKSATENKYTATKLSH